MKIACFFPQSLYSAWSVSEGIVDTLKRMGHEPIACPIVPGAGSKENPLQRGKYPKFEELEACDGVLVSGPEHITKYIQALYPNWCWLKNTVAWWHETVERSDYGKMPVEKINAHYHKAFTPAAQDEKFGMTWLPFGVDTVMFHVLGPYASIYQPKLDIGVGFVGLCYGPRAEFVNKYGLQDIIRFGKCEVTDFDGVNVRKSTELYSDTLRRTKIMPVLPSLCRHSVTKIFEIPACGAVVVTHKVEDPRNHVLKSGVYYETGEDLRSILTDLLANDAKREEIARKQCEEVHAHHRLDQRIEKILEAMR